MPIPENDDDEMTASRERCFCGGVITVKGGEVTHTAPRCQKFSAGDPVQFLRELHAAHAKEIAQS